MQKRQCTQYAASCYGDDMDKLFKRYWLIAMLFGCALAAFPLLHFQEVARMNYKTRNMTTVFFEALKRKDYETASHLIYTINTIEEGPNDSNAGAAAAWIAKQQDLNEDGIEINDIVSIEVHRDDYCSFADVELIINDNGRQERFTQRISSPKPCSGASFSSLYVPYQPIGHDAIDKAKNAMSSFVQAP